MDLQMQIGSKISIAMKKLLPWVCGIWILSLLAVSSPARGQDLPDAAFISGLVGHAQSYGLSCESRSAVDLAGYWGVSISEWEFLSALPVTDNPDTGFVGSYNGYWGSIPPASYGVHAKPVAALLRQYGLQVKARRDLSWDELREEIFSGRPVIVWIIGQMWSGTPIDYTSSDGHKTTVARFEHTMIVSGYDLTYVYADRRIFRGQHVFLPQYFSRTRGACWATWRSPGKGQTPRLRPLLRLQTEGKSTPHPAVATPCNPAIT